MTPIEDLPANDAVGDAQSGRVPATVVIVTFNSQDTIRACVRSVPAALQTIVVDQGSSDATLAAVTSARPDVLALKAGRNRGFGAGCNLGAANAVGDVLIFLNPDARFAPGAADVLIGRALADNALVGPRIHDVHGKDHTRARNWTTLGADLADVCLPPHRVPRRWLRAVPPSDPVYRTGGPVPYVHGSCMAVPRRAFLDSGCFDETYFLYHEEEDLALRLRDLGVNAVLEPAAVVIHEGGHSTRGHQHFAARQFFRSRSLFYMQRYGTGRGASASLLLAVALLAMALSTPWRRRARLHPENSASWYWAGLGGVLSGVLGQQEVGPPHDRRVRR